MVDRGSRLHMTDVYDIAANIGHELEGIIAQYGSDSVSKLMPQIIHILEQLEFVTLERENDGREMLELKYLVDKMQLDKSEKANEHVKFEKDLEDIESSWKTQMDDMRQTVNKLKEQNIQLQEALGESEPLSGDHSKEINEMKSRILELEAGMQEYKGEMRQLRRQLKQKTIDIESLQSQVEQLAKENSFLSHKENIASLEIETLLDERNELEERLVKKESEVAVMQEFTHAPGIDSTATTPAGDENKLFDPNKPRFTIEELKTVVMERNDLKAKLIKIQEKLNIEQSWKSHSLGYDDAPVQGPINREPYEKLFPDHSYIRKLFNNMFPSPHSARSRKSKKSPKK